MFFVPSYGVSIPVMLNTNTSQLLSACFVGKLTENNLFVVPTLLGEVFHNELCKIGLECTYNVRIIGYSLLSTMVCFIVIYYLICGLAEFLWLKC